LALTAVRQLERLSPGHELAMAYGNISQRRMVVSDLEQARAWGERGLELATRLGDLEAQVYATINIGSAELQAGIDGGEAKLEQALALARRAGLEDYVGRVYARIAMHAVQSHAYARAEEYLSPGLDYCRQRGLDTWRLYLLACRAEIELERGQW